MKKGTWQKSPTIILDVAVKMIQKSCTVTDRVKFLQEAAIMAQFKHQNVISLYGVTEKDGIVS